MSKTPKTFQLAGATAPTASGELEPPAVTPVPKQATKKPVTSRPHEPATSARARFSAPPATADTTTSYTLRLHVDDAAEVDELRARLRKRTGRRALDQAEVIRILLRLAIDDEAIRAALVSELTTS